MLILFQIGFLYHFHLLSLLYFLACLFTSVLFFNYIIYLKTIILYIFLKFLCISRYPCNIITAATMSITPFLFSLLTLPCIKVFSAATVDNLSSQYSIFIPVSSSNNSQNFITFSP